MNVHHTASDTGKAKDILVLVVEDDFLIEGWLEASIERVGFTVVKVSSGYEAIAMLNISSLGFRALVADVKLGPGPTGWEVARRARRDNGSLPVIYISGSCGDEWETEGVAESIFIGKPFTCEQILAALSQLVNGNETAACSTGRRL
jgi:DNA-binding response OmpR family regulator